MPIYEYTCESCQAAFELLVPMSASDAVQDCPECGSSKTRKMPSVFFGRSASKDGGQKSVAGSGGCGSCTATSCGSCCGH